MFELLILMDLMMGIVDWLGDFYTFSSMILYVPGNP